METKFLPTGEVTVTFYANEKCIHLNQTLAISQNSSKTIQIDFWMVSVYILTPLLLLKIFVHDTFQKIL